MPIDTTLAQLSDALMYSATAVYVVAVLFYAVGAVVRGRGLSPAPALVPVAAGASPEGAAAGKVAEVPSTPDTSRTRQLGNVAIAQTLLAVVLHAAAVLARGLATGRAPWGNMYEFATTGALAATVAYLLLLRREPVRELGLWIVGVVSVGMGLAVTALYTPAGDLVPALNSYWLVIHVAAAIVSGGVFTLGAAATVLYLLRSRADRRGRAGGYSGQLPTADRLEKIAHGAHLVAFPVWTFAVIAGAVWAEESWGRYWGWDPKETWAFITWVLYAAHLHADATVGWRGPRAAWFAVAGYLSFLFNFFGVNLWITGLHSYAGV